MTRWLSTFIRSILTRAVRSPLWFHYEHKKNQFNKWLQTIKNKKIKSINAFTLNHNNKAWIKIGIYFSLLQKKDPVTNRDNQCTVLQSCSQSIPHHNPSPNYLKPNRPWPSQRHLLEIRPVLGSRCLRPARRSSSTVLWSTLSRWPCLVCKPSRQARRGETHFLRPPKNRYKN